MIIHAFPLASKPDFVPCCDQDRHDLPITDGIAVAPQFVTCGVEIDLESALYAFEARVAERTRLYDAVHEDGEHFMRPSLDYCEMQVSECRDVLRRILG